MTVCCQLCQMWLMMTGYYSLLSFTQGCRDILFVLRLLPATDTPVRKWVTQMCVAQKYLLSLCCVGASDVRCLCCAGVRGPSPETLSSLAQAEGLSSSCCPSTGAELETSEELISSEIRSKMGLRFLIYCIPTGFPFQTWFVEMMEGHIRCIS